LTGHSFGNHNKKPLFAPDYCSKENQIRQEKIGGTVYICHLKVKRNDPRLKEPIEAWESSVPASSDNETIWWMDGRTSTTRTTYKVEEDLFTSAYHHWMHGAAEGAAEGSGGSSSSYWWNFTDNSKQNENYNEPEEKWFWDTNEIYDEDGDLIAVGLLSVAYLCSLEAYFMWLDYPRYLKDKMEDV
jgi:hypothetical protein